MAQESRVEPARTAEFVGSLALRRSMMSEKKIEEHCQERMIQALPREMQGEARDRLKRVRAEWEREDRLSRI